MFVLSVAADIAGRSGWTTLLDMVPKVPFHAIPDCGLLFAGRGLSRMKDPSGLLETTRLGLARSG
jgi:hypothetical protein